MQHTIEEFKRLIEQFPKAILALSPEVLQEKPALEKWSKKEIVGHLIDSATINYLRLIKAQFQDNPQLFYEQEDYCQSANYQETPNAQLIQLWETLNRQLLFLFETVLQRQQEHKKCNDHTLAYLMQDYVAHFKHHQAQILGPQ